MIEVVAAVVGSVLGSVLTFAGVSLSGSAQRNNDGREAVIRLTAAVENVATRLDQIHLDIKADRQETYARLNSVEQRLAKVEALQRG